MSRINPIFTAMTEVDEKIIAEAKKPNRKPLIRMGVIAAASAAAVVALGFGVVQLARINQTSNGVVYNAGNSTNSTARPSDVIDSTVEDYPYPLAHSAMEAITGMHYGKITPEELYAKLNNFGIPTKPAIPSEQADSGISFASLSVNISLDIPAGASFVSPFWFTVENDDSIELNRSLLSDTSGEFCINLYRKPLSGSKDLEKPAADWELCDSMKFTFADSIGWDSFTGLEDSYMYYLEFVNNNTNAFTGTIVVTDKSTDINTEGNSVKLDNIKVHNITVPDEFKPVDGEKSRSIEHIEMLPSEVFDKFGLTMLTSENFTEKLNPELNVNTKACIYVWEESIAINYILYDKNISKNFTIRSQYYTSDANVFLGASGIGTETITLKDGSKAYIQPNYAIFTYNGVIYVINPTSSDSDITEMKQMIADLGIL